MSSPSLPNNESTRNTDLKIPPGYAPEPRVRRTTPRRESFDLSPASSTFYQTGPTCAVKQRKVCCLHVTTATLLVCVLTIIIQVVPYMMIGGIFVSNGGHGTGSKPLATDSKASSALLVAGILLLLEAGGLLITDVMLLLGVMMDRYSRVIPYVIMQVITIVTGVFIAILSTYFSIKSVFEVMIYYGFAAIFNVFALYTVTLCYLEMKEQERMYKYFAVRMAELAALARNQLPYNTGRFTSSPVPMSSFSPPLSPGTDSSKDLRRRSSRSPDDKDSVGRSIPRLARSPGSMLTGAEQPNYPDMLANSIPSQHSKINVEIPPFQEYDRPASVPIPSQSYWKKTSSKESGKAAKSMEGIVDHDHSKDPRQTSHVFSGSVSSKSTLSVAASSQTSSESMTPIMKATLKPSKRPSGGAQSWAYNMMDIFRPQTSSSMKSARDLTSLQSQWQTIQQSLVSQSDSTSHARISSPPNAPPGNKASYPGFVLPMIPPGNKASYTGSMANIPPGNKATSFITPTSSFSSGAYSGSGHAFYPPPIHPLHPSSGHTLHALGGRTPHPAAGHNFNQLPRSPGREGARKMSHPRERRFTVNQAPIVEESSVTTEPGKEKKVPAKKKVSKDQKKK